MLTTIPFQKLALGHQATTHALAFRNKPGYLLGPRLGPQDRTLGLAAAFIVQVS